MLNRVRARILLAECRGDEIWSVEYCQQHHIPTGWIEALADCFESGFRHHRDTIYHENVVTNQFHGVRDLDLAIRLAELLGVDTRRVLGYTRGDLAVVAALQEAVDE